MEGERLIGGIAQLLGDIVPGGIGAMIDGVGLEGEKVGPVRGGEFIGTAGKTGAEHSFGFGAIPGSEVIGDDGAYRLQIF